MREPFRPVTVPEGLDLTSIDPAAVIPYALALQPPALHGDPVPAGIDGSNNWVLSGSRTATGRPILCNDPHRDTTAMPGLRYLTHLSGPDFDVIGAGEAHLPGISLGHTAPSPSATRSS